MNRNAVVWTLAVVLALSLFVLAGFAHSVLDRLALVEARAEICMDVLRLEGPL
jgi:hypothetical protein